MFRKLGILFVILSHGRHMALLSALVLFCFRESLLFVVAHISLRGPDECSRLDCAGRLWDAILLLSTLGLRNKLTQDMNFMFAFANGARVVNMHYDVWVSRCSTSHCIYTPVTRVAE